MFAWKVCLYKSMYKFTVIYWMLSDEFMYINVRLIDLSNNKMIKYVSNIS